MATQIPDPHNLELCLNCPLSRYQLDYHQSCDLILTNNKVRHQTRNQRPHLITPYLPRIAELLSEGVTNPYDLSRRLGVNNKQVYNWAVNQGKLKWHYGDPKLNNGSRVYIVGIVET